MTLARPLFLLALLSLPVLWLLSRRLRARRPYPVSSLLIWRRVGLVPNSPREVRRRADRLLALRLAVAAAISLGLAGVGIRRGEDRPVLPVLLDDSASMTAFADRSEAALEAIGDAAGDAELVLERSSGHGGLASLLGRYDGDVVLVTDHPPEGLPEGGRVRVVLVGGPVENVGIVSAWLAGGGSSFAAVVRNFADVEQTRTVRAGNHAETRTLAAGEAALVRGPAPGGRVRIRLDPEDPFAFDDEVEVERRPARQVSLAWRGPDAPRLALALEVGGVRFDPDATDVLAYRTEATPRTRLLVAPPGDRREQAPEGPVGGAALAADAVPPPGLPLGPVAVLDPGGEALLFDSGGPLAVRRGERVEIGPDPEDPASRWSSDPSFPVFIAEVARMLGARPPGTVETIRSFGAGESATRPSFAPADLSGLRASRAGDAPEPFDGSPIFFLLAVAGLVAHTWLERRGAAPAAPAAGGKHGP